MAFVSVMCPFCGRMIRRKQGRKSEVILKPCSKCQQKLKETEQ